MQRVTPVLAGLWLMSGLASIALPGLSGFVPEYLVLMGTWTVSGPLALFAVLGVVIAALYVLMPYQRVFTGAPGKGKEDLADLGGARTLRHDSPRGRDARPWYLVGAPRERPDPGCSRPRPDSLPGRRHR